MSHRWFAHLKSSVAEIEVGLTTTSTFDTHLEMYETESDFALAGAIQALSAEPDLVRARHIAARAIERVRDRVRGAAMASRERAD